ncbi:MAG: UDP-glucose 6-dehydrogenase [Elusimicrobia bacterium GWA2_69_24]|nr:MAG: UDP-glucose 6-dehydrogenase [Elusimicrobia bacterium GWA2_69_24]HBL17191.1 UDP-glucose 6-dehydrogenase [Elusimicrobiota bacterium]
MKSHSICVVGTGYVGLVTGACMAEVGHRVVCVDSDRSKIKLLRSGRCPIHEPGLLPIIKKNVAAGRLVFTTSIAQGMRRRDGDADVAFIAVGTPPKPDGSADLTFVEAVAAEIATSMRDYAVIVDKSTVPVETGTWVEKTVRRVNKHRVPFDVASNPEFLAEGTAVHDTMHPDRIVFGVSSPRAEKVLREVYAPFRAPVLVTDVKSAELIKHASNSFLATKISFINAVSRVCEAVGADVSLVAQGMGLDKRIGSSFLRPGLGFGGFCFPKDLEAFYWIAKQKGYDFGLLREVTEVNKTQKDWVTRHLESELWNLQGKRVAILGLAFKPNTDDLRFAPSLSIISDLQARKVRIAVHDPIAMPKARGLLKGVTFAKDPYAAAKGADCLILVTEWGEYQDLDLRRIQKLMANPFILDGRNLFDPILVRGLGFVYRSVGRP